MFQNESKEDKERWKNLLFFKMYATNKELDESAPLLITIFIALVIVFLCFAFIKC